MAANRDCPSTHCKNCPAWASSAFAHLSDVDLDRLQHEKVEAIYERGDAFSQKGQPAEDVYCLGVGSAKVTLVDEQTGRESLVRLVAPGDMLGYRCIFSAEKFRGTATALTKSHACKFSKALMFELIEREPKFSFDLLRRMGMEVANAEYHHHSFCQKNVRERLAEALLILKEKFGKETALGWKIDTRLTRTELSNWVGASREGVIRQLTEFAQERLIEQIGDFTYLKNIEKLGAIIGSTIPAQVTLPRLIHESHV